MQSPSHQPIQANLWWVIPGKLAGMRMPTREELPALQAAGIRAIASVFHEAINLDTYQQAHIPHIWLPIAIDSVPTSEQRQAFQQFVEQQMALGHGVAVHCSTGRHRTGTMLAAYLIQTGQTYEQAMATLLLANPEIELPIPQANFLQLLGQAKVV